MKRREASPNIPRPNRPSKPASVVSHPCPEKISPSFQEPSVKHHLPRIVGKDVTTVRGSVLCSFKTWVSAQSVDYFSVNLSISMGSMSKLLKTLLLRSFYIYHRIQANWWFSICGRTLQKRWFISVKRDFVGKETLFDDPYKFSFLIWLDLCWLGTWVSIFINIWTISSMECKKSQNKDMNKKWMTYDLFLRLSARHCYLLRLIILPTLTFQVVFLLALLFR